LIVSFLDLNENQLSDRIVELGKVVPASSIREFVLPDDSRIDIETDTTSFEVEWSYKWKEAIGQSLFYAIQTGKEPGIILLQKGEPEDKVNFLRCKLVCAKYDIRLIVVKVKDLK
jgi:hypothetical protein